MGHRWANRFDIKRASLRGGVELSEVGAIGLGKHVVSVCQQKRRRRAAARRLGMYGMGDGSSRRRWSPGTVATRH
jgi:hypothetical protein